MRPYLCLASALLLAGPAVAAPPIAVPPELRRSAMPCLAEALRLCPGALTAKDHGASCIVAERRRVGAACRGVLVQGLRLLGGGDVHLDLRVPRKP